MKPALLVTAVLGVLALAGCKHSKSGQSADGGSLAPPTSDTPPASFGASGLIIDQPADGSQVSGKWCSVSGWYDPTRIALVRVIGGESSPELYQVQEGHMGLPSVPVLMLPNGRFIAPRVPLDEGTTQVVVYTLPESSTTTTVLHLTATGTSEAPATLVVSPASVGVGQPATIAARAPGGTGNWQLDTDGDGTFDQTVADSASIAVTWSTAGTRHVLARRQVGGVWLYATALVQVTPAPNKVAEAQVTTPTALAVVEDARAWLVLAVSTTPLSQGLQQAASAGQGFTKFVLAADGNAVKVYDGNLTLQRTLSGATQPAGVAGDGDGRVYVSDSGGNRILRFAADGTLDTSFGNQGALTSVLGTPLANPGALSLQERLDSTGNAVGYELVVLDRGNQRLLDCEGSPIDGTPTCTAMTSVGTAPLNGGIGSGALAIGTRMEGRGDFGDPTTGALQLPGALAEGSKVMQFGPLATTTTRSVPSPLQALATGNVRGVALPYVVGADAQGNLVEWMGSVMPTRTRSLGFPVTQVAFASLDTALANSGSPLSSSSSGSLVVYAAGAGHLQKLVLEPLTLEVW